IWDLAGGKELRRYDLAWHRIDTLKFSPDSTLLAIAGQARIALWRRWATDDPRTVQVGGRYISTMAFSPDGSMLALGWDARNGISLFDLAREVREDLVMPTDQFPHDYVRDLAFSPDGRRIAAASNRNSGSGVNLWDITTKTLSWTAETSGIPGHVH